MTLTLLLIFGILPSIVWLAFYLRRDKHPEPNRMVLKIFLLGMLATVPAIFLELGIRDILQVPSPIAAYNILYIFVGVAFVEEFIKYFVVRWQVYKSPQLDEAIDLPLYMIISALGFAALENILMLSGLGPTPLANDILRLSIFRFIGATFLHALASGILGYFLVLSLYQQKRKFWYVLAGFALVTFLHGLFNFSIIELELPEQVLVPAVVILLMATFLSIVLTKLQRIQTDSEGETHRASAQKGFPPSDAR